MQVDLHGESVDLGASYDYYDGESVDLMGGRLRNWLRKKRKKFVNKIRAKRKALKGKSRAERRKIRRKFRRATMARVFTAMVPGARTVQALILAKKLRARKRRRRAARGSSVSRQIEMQKAERETLPTVRRRKRRRSRRRRRRERTGRTMNIQPVERSYPVGQRGGAPMPSAITPQVEVAQSAVAKPDMQKMLIPMVAIGAAAFFMMQKKKK